MPKYLKVAELEIFGHIWLQIGVSGLR